MYGYLTGMLVHFLSHLNEFSLEAENPVAFFIDVLVRLATILGPMMLIVPIMGLCANLAQVGPLFTTKTLMPKLSKLNPLSGLQKLFSARSLMELFKSLCKIAIIAFTAYLTIRSEMPTILMLGDMPPIQIGHFVLAVSFEIFLKTCWVLFALAVLDFAFQKWQYNRDMMMSKEEIKEEMKQMEGDPMIKSRIRAAQRDTARKRMMAKVPEADVVVTNPTHFAVALRYDAKQADAPMVVAKGQNLIAERIKEIAREHQIPIMEDKPLARALYKSVDVGQMIPVQFYQAVAEILSYVYRVKGKTGAWRQVIPQQS